MEHCSRIIKVRKTFVHVIILGTGGVADQSWFLIIYYEKNNRKHGVNFAQLVKFCFNLQNDGKLMFTKKQQF